LKLTNVILLLCAFSVSAFAADNTQTSKGSDNEIQIPTMISGVVVPLTRLGFCMDGATHVIHSTHAAYRLQGNSPEATKALKEVADGVKKVSVMGYPLKGAECSHISVYSVETMKLFTK